MVLALFGAGNMGTAIAAGLVGQNILPGSQLLVYDLDQAKAKKLAGSCGASVLGQPQKARQAADTILLAVKPQDVSQALEQLGQLGKGQLLISIAAGTSLALLRRLCGPDAGLARVMPNLPALVGFAASAVCFADATEEQKELTLTFFKALGQVYELPETAFAAFTGLAGSGPAYVMQVIEALADGAVRMGMDRTVALPLAGQTVLGSAVYLQKSGLHPAQVKDQVSSPGGTTIEALAVLEKHGLRSALIEAVAAATEKAKKLGRQEEDND